MEAIGDAENEVVGAVTEDDSRRRQGRTRYRMQMIRSNVFLVILFAGGVAAVYGLSLREGPAEASAEQQVAEAQVDSAILRISQEEARRMNLPTSGRISRRVLQAFYDQIAQRQVPLNHLRKNPFLFVLPGPKAQTVLGKPAAAVSKSENARKEDTYEDAQAVFKTLHLQSILMGQEGGTAIISNNLLTVGQEIECFRIKSVTRTRVVLCWQDREFILDMP